MCSEIKLEKETLELDKRILRKLKEVLKLSKNYQTEDKSLENEFIEEIASKIKNGSSILDIEDENGQSYLVRLQKKCKYIPKEDYDAFFYPKFRGFFFNLEFQMLLKELIGDYFYNKYKYLIKKIFEEYIYINKKTLGKEFSIKSNGEVKRKLEDMYLDYNLKDEAIKNILNYLSDKNYIYNKIQEDNIRQIKTIESKMEIFEKKYEILDFKHALAILKIDFFDEFEDILDILNNFELLASDMIKPGGNKSLISKKIESEFYSKGWRESSFEIKNILEVKENGKTFEKKSFKENILKTHKIDCFKNRIAFEIEWNNKTEFYDRDLNNFRFLFEKDIISVGIIITRTEKLEKIFKEFKNNFQDENDDIENLEKQTSKYGASTTRISKLLLKIKNGVAGGCPILVIGIKG